MPRREKIEFDGHDGHHLAGLLEAPDAEPIGTALFAHCFTCGKDIAAASRIARALVARGYQVMRFADRCPVHRTLEGPLEIRTRLQDAS